jgi:hypothetical protein
MSTFFVHAHSLDSFDIHTSTEAPNVMAAWNAAVSRRTELQGDCWGTVEQMIEGLPEKPGGSTTEMAWEFKSIKGRLMLTPFQGYKEKMIGHCDKCEKFGVVTKEINYRTLGSDLAPRLTICGPCKAKDPLYKEAIA